MLSLPTSDSGLMLIKQTVTTNGTTDLEQESTDGGHAAEGAVDNRDLSQKALVELAISGSVGRFDRKDFQQISAIKTHPAIVRMVSSYPILYN